MPFVSVQAGSDDGVLGQHRVLCELADDRGGAGLPAAPEPNLHPLRPLQPGPGPVLLGPNRLVPAGGSSLPAASAAAAAGLRDRDRDREDAAAVDLHDALLLQVRLMIRARTEPTLIIYHRFTLTVFNHLNRN